MIKKILKAKIKEFYVEKGKLDVSIKVNEIPEETKIRVSD